MRKLLIILTILLILGCKKSKEERIIEYFQVELQKRNLKIVASDGFEIAISPIKNSNEAYSPNVYELYAIDDEDSLKLKISETVKHISKWFTLPKWEQTKGNIYPYISTKKEYITEHEYLEAELSNNSVFHFEHHNHDTRRHHNINEYDLIEWKKSKAEIKEIAFENLAKLYQTGSKLTTDFQNNVSFLRIKSNDGRLENSLLFIEHSQKELDSIIGYPYYAIVSTWIPQFIFKPKDLEYFKNYIKTNKPPDSTIELVKFTENGFEMSKLE